MKKQFVFILVIAVFFGCKNEKKSNGKLNVVTTTSMITDLVKNIAGEHINVQGLMGSGVDPHLYKASEGDVSKLSNADIIFYNGLHLEGKLVEVFEKMKTILPWLIVQVSTSCTYNSIEKSLYWYISSKLVIMA